LKSKNSENEMKIYSGFKEGRRTEIIHLDTQPTKKSHPQCDFVYGPFKMEKDASDYVKAMTGLAFGNGK
jgi:hypothetical protein